MYNCVAHVDVFDTVSDGRPHSDASDVGSR